MRLISMLAAALFLCGCAGEPKTVLRDRVVEVKVPVASPCKGQLPDPVTAMRDQFSEDEWAALSTDQRAAVVAAQALARTIYGNRLADATAGCR